MLLNRNKETQIFATEIAKFKPIQTKLTANIQAHQQMLQELGNEYGRLRDSSNGLKTLEGRDRRRGKIVAEWREYYLRWKETRDGLNRGIQVSSTHKGTIGRGRHAFLTNIQPCIVVLFWAE